MLQRLREVKIVNGLVSGEFNKNGGTDKGDGTKSGNVIY